MMQNRLGRAAVLTAFVTLIGPMHAVAVHAYGVVQAGPTAQEPATAKGELVRVDPDAKTLAIKTASGTEMQFKYTDATSVTGAEKGVAGLATMSGAQLTVSFRIEGTSNVATKIEVRGKS
jgi:hypothetical protein